MEVVNGRNEEGLPDRNGQEKIFQLCVGDFDSDKDQEDKTENCGQAFLLNLWGVNKLPQIN